VAGFYSAVDTRDLCNRAIAATPVFGGHYFVDLIAGVILALTVIKLVRYFSLKSEASVQSLRDSVGVTA
jgi:hypothetical protein